MIGYMRVSTKKQETLLQRNALTVAGVEPENIYQDTMSGATTVRRGLDNCLARLEKGDVLVVWKLDRLGRSFKHLMETVENLKKKGVGFKCIMDPIDTTTPAGELVFHIFGALAQFERTIITSRVKAGVDAYREENPQWGKRPQTEYDPEAVIKFNEGGKSNREIAKLLGISKNTVARVIQRKQINKIEKFI